MYCLASIAAAIAKKMVQSDISSFRQANYKTIAKCDPQKLTPKLAHKRHFSFLAAFLIFGSIIHLFLFLPPSLPPSPPDADHGDWSWPY